MCTSNLDPQQHVKHEQQACCGSLVELVAQVSAEISAQGGVPDDKKALQAVMERFSGSQREFAKYAHFDRDQNYTRNLVATDGKTFALIVLCWTPGKGSPVHDHPGDGCWMSVLQGGLRETHYRVESGKEGGLRKVSEAVHSRQTGEGVTCAYIDDSIALHKIENTSPDVGAISLHLYSPPPSMCTVWHDVDRADLSKPGRGDCFYSKHGERCDQALENAAQRG
jgi:cysteine dioxygenase